jgi:hypothetical protein
VAEEMKSNKASTAAEEITSPKASTAAEAITPTKASTAAEKMKSPTGSTLASSPTATTVAPSPTESKVSLEEEMELSDSGSKGLELSDSYLAEKISQSLKEAEGGLELRFSGQFAKIPAIDELLEKVVEKANGSFSVWRSGQDTFKCLG